MRRHIKFGDFFFGASVSVPFDFILDDYSGAVAAYSLSRKLSSTYNGSAFRIKAGGIETDIGYVDNLVDLATAQLFIGSNNAYFTKVYDNTGNGNHLVQATDANMPLFAQSGVINLINTKPAMFFNGTSNYLTFTNPISENQPWSVFQVAKRYAASKMGPVLSSSTAGAPFAIMEYSDDFYYLRSGSGTRFSNATDTSIRQKVLAGIYNATSGYIWKNEVSVATSGNGTAGTGNFIDYGRRESVYTNADAQELIIYASDKTSSQSGISGNMAKFYSVYVGSQATTGYQVDVVGQSNGTDRFDKSALPSYLQTTLADCWTFYKSTDNATDNGNWELITTGVNTTPGGGLLNKFAWSVPMAYKLKHTYSKAAYVVPSGIGGTGLDNSVSPGWYPTHVNEYYQRSVTNSTQAESKRSLAPSIQRVVVIDHGQYDAGDATMAANYETNLTAWINAYRTSFSNPSLKVVVILLSTASTMTYASTVRQAQINVVNNMTNVYSIDQSNYDLQDGQHLTNDAAISFGYGMADLITTL